MQRARPLGGSGLNSVSPWSLLWATRGRCTASMIRLSVGRDTSWRSASRARVKGVVEVRAETGGPSAEPASATNANRAQAHPRPGKRQQDSRTAVMYSAIRQHYCHTLDDLHPARRRISGGGRLRSGSKVYHPAPVQSLAASTASGEPWIRVWISQLHALAGNDGRDTR